MKNNLMFIFVLLVLVFFFIYFRLFCPNRFYFFFSSRRRHTSFSRDWRSDVCSSDLGLVEEHHLRVVDQCPSDSETLPHSPADRKSVVWGKSVDLGGRRIIKKKI